MSEREARDQVEELWNGDLQVTDALGRQACLHWSRFHGLIVSMDAPGAVYLGQPATLAWIAEAAGYRKHPAITDAQIQRLREAIAAQSPEHFYPSIETAELILRAALGEENA